jgi:hypothetical protein
MIVRKHLGPAPGWTSRAEIERNVTVMLGATPIGASVRGDQAQVGFVAGDGTRRMVAADHVIAATGFKVDMWRLGFIAPQIMNALKLADQTPVLSPFSKHRSPGCSRSA